ncbi:MAG: hypothetical protein FJ336_04605 [Sphingomonadales bacterium]|nr:hypothetical protein [Sphingomonadales bacterium]
MKFLIYTFLQGLSFVRSAWYRSGSHCLFALFSLGVALGPDRIAAQTKSDPGWSSLRMGLQASLQPSWIASDNRQIQSGQAGLGWSIGLNAVHSLAPRYAFLTGVLLRGNVFNVMVDSFRYQIRGMDMDTVLRDIRYQYRTQGLEIPLMLRLGGAQSSNKSSPYALFGLTTMWNTRVRASFEGQELIGYEAGDFFDPSTETYRVTNVPGSPVDQDDRVALFSAWLGIGLGWEFPLPSAMRLSTGLRYDYPMSQVFRGDYFKGRLQSMQFSAYITF